ncbi:peptide deformylase [Sanguibacter sp. HDW7]|uniref:peptide deformylase n=1 Tax=Sanguibacter sp. HDW7 TaxID=2714931 RepID=UPI00140BEA33|nr:peptide deformylase [Sanguibacter sp. HDW7]QIK82764.1 peptide deformylase [Sanguibacter sp. HDW7]
MNSFPGPVLPELRDAVRGLLDAHPDGVLPIVQAGHPVLRQVAATYTGQLGDVLDDLLAAMVATMHAAPGVGLAAPQIGVGLAIAVLEDPGLPAGYGTVADARERAALPLRVLVNPTYEAVGDERVTFYEGCLSVEGYQASVARHRSVRVRGLDGSGAVVEEVVHGWPARIVQHETDHLHGTLYVDRAETRSLCANATYAALWSDEAVPRRASHELGFPLEVASAPGR